MTEPRRRRSRALRATAEGVAAHAREQIERVRDELGAFLAPLRGDERALDVGTGAGTLALALAPLVGEVVGVDLVPELLAAARETRPRTSTFVEGDAAALPFDAARSTSPARAGRSTTWAGRSSRSPNSRASRARRPGVRRRPGRAGGSARGAELDRFERRATPRITARFPTATFATCSTRTASCVRSMPSRTARAGLLPRARGLHGRGRRAGEGALAGRPRALRRRVALVPLREALALQPDAGRGDEPRDEVRRERLQRSRRSRYQRGTVVSRRPLADGADDVPRDVLGPDHRAAGRARSAARRAAGSPRSRRSPGLTVCTRMPRGRSCAAVARENASCACFDAEYGPLGGNATVPATETTLTTSDGARRLERRAGTRAGTRRRRGSSSA